MYNLPLELIVDIAETDFDTLNKWESYNKFASCEVYNKDYYLIKFSIRITRTNRYCIITAQVLPNGLFHGECVINHVLDMLTIKFNYYQGELLLTSLPNFGPYMLD